MTNKQIENNRNVLKSRITPDIDEVIESENVIFHLEEQKNNNNPNVSSIDLEEC